MPEIIRLRPTIELRQIRSFVTLAQELNFHKAAERLFITQPSLSHQIALLEATIGARLFQRDRRRVALTEAGRAILDDAEQLLAQLDMMVMKVRRIVAVDSSTLRVGFPEYANRTFIPSIAAAFRSRHPEINLKLTEGYSGALLQELREGRLDVAFVRIPPAGDPVDLSIEQIIDEPHGLLLAADHPLAARTEVPVAALAGEQLLLMERPVNPALYDRIVAWLQQNGVKPRFLKIDGPGVYTFETMLMVIQSGEAITLSSATMAGDLPPGVVFRPFIGPTTRFQVGVAWSATNRSSRLYEFLSVTRELRDHDPARASAETATLRAL
jgi:DNA-binding transcriptional LysR family regulator